jgi:hypothetical protein
LAQFAPIDLRILKLGVALSDGDNYCSIAKSGLKSRFDFLLSPRGRSGDRELMVDRKGQLIWPMRFSCASKNRDENFSPETDRGSRLEKEKGSTD